MYKELSHSDTTAAQEVLTLDHQRTAKLNNSKDLSIIEEGSVTKFDAVTRIHVLLHGKDEENCLKAID